MQYRFDLAWCELMQLCAQEGHRGYRRYSYVSVGRSADAWSEPENFWLSDTGKAIEISGAPPDNFAPEGPGVSNPTFRWDHMKQNSYSWWIHRLVPRVSPTTACAWITSWIPQLFQHSCG